MERDEKLLPRLSLAWLGTQWLRPFEPRRCQTALGAIVLRWGVVAGTLTFVKSLRSWLVPTLVAPVLGAWVYVFVAASLSSWPLPKWLWLLAAAVASGAALGVGILTALLDLALLRLRLRTPPVGWRAWTMGFVIPFPVFFSWQKLARFALLGWGYALLWVILPMVVTAVALRFLAARRPLHW